LIHDGYGEAVSEEPTQPPAETELTSAYPEPRPMPYGSSPYATSPPLAPTEGVEGHRALVEPADVWTALLGSIGVASLGVLAGFVWLWLAPRALTTSDGKGHSSLLNPSTKAFAGADVTFLFIGIVAGLICGVCAAVLARHRGLAVSVAMGVGGTLASLIAAWIGRALSGGPNNYWLNHATAGNHRFFIELATRPYLMAWPVTALVVTFIVAMFTPDRPIDIEPTEPAPAEAAVARPGTVD
jgi:hypothetical protein